MTTTETTIADVLATYDRRMAAIEARTVPHLNYVLSWGDGRYVRYDADKGAAHVTGYEHATFWGGREAANAYLKRTMLTDGRGQRPHVVNAFNAKQGAIIQLQGVIDMVRAQTMLDTGEA